MTEPHFALPGDTVMATRRTLRRHHLFRPDAAIRQLYLYVLAVCAKQFGILVHAVTLMSTHEHLVITDPKRCYPDLLRDLHRLVSLGANVLRKCVYTELDRQPHRGWRSCRSSTYLLNDPRTGGRRRVAETRQHVWGDGYALYRSSVAANLDEPKSMSETQSNGTLSPQAAAVHHAGWWRGSRLLHLPRPVGVKKEVAAGGAA